MSLGTPPHERMFGGTLSAAGRGAITPRPKNPLLVRDDVGKAKPSCYDLPDDQFAFGRPGNQDMEGAREVSMRWVAHTPSRGPEGGAPDFIHFNKKATAARICTSKDLKHYRKDRDLLSMTPRADQAMQQTARSKAGGHDLIPSDVVPGFTYGRKVRPSTPIQKVISARFAEKSERELDSFYAEMKEAKERSGQQVRKIPLTAASRGHASAARKAALHQEDNKELFKLSRFKRAEAKVSTKHKKNYTYDDDSLDIPAVQLDDLGFEPLTGRQDDVPE